MAQLKLVVTPRLALQVVRARHGRFGFQHGDREDRVAVEKVERA